MGVADVADWLQEENGRVGARDRAEEPPWIRRLDSSLLGSDRGRVATVRVRWVNDNVSLWWLLFFSPSKFT